MRLDKWLWASRFYRTRRIAIDEINRGRVQVNGNVAKPARMIAVGDIIVVNKLQTIFEIKVLKLLPERGPAKVAQTMYQESEESVERREHERALRRLSTVVRPKNPTSRERKELRKLRQGLHNEDH